MPKKLTFWSKEENNVAGNATCELTLCLGWEETGTCMNTFVENMAQQFHIYNKQKIK